MDNFEQKYIMTFNEDKPINEAEFVYNYEDINIQNKYNFLAEFENQISQKLKKTSSMYILGKKRDIIIISPKSKSSKTIKRIEYANYNY